MRQDSGHLEQTRMEGLSFEAYPFLHERHRVFPEVFENRKHRRILDTSAGIGVVAKRITDRYECELTCNEVDPNCLEQLSRLPVKTLSLDLDRTTPLPMDTESYDAVICLATLEHLLNTDFFVQELNRILHRNGRLYMTIPNYASIYWLIPILKGKTFHDPFDERSRYEFYAHVRYFTYHSLLEYMRHFGFYTEVVYLPLPQGSSKFQELRNKSPLKAFLIRNILRLTYLLSPRWHQEPVICFTKEVRTGKPRKVLM